MRLRQATPHFAPGLTAMAVLATLLCLSPPPLAAPGDGPSSATPAGVENHARKVEELIARHSRIPDQARALAELIWIDKDRDPAMARHARQRLIGYGHNALLALGNVVGTADPIYSADIVLALHSARLKITAGRPVELLPALDNVLWAGSVDAKKLVIPMIAESKFRASLLPMIDAAYEHEELIPVVAHYLPRFRDDRVRHFLGDILQNGKPEDRRAAAVALARVGGRCIDTLRDGMLHADADVRKLSVESLLPHTGVDSLTSLYEYVMEHPDDDPALLAKVRMRAEQLEFLLERQAESDSASPTD